ncbi:c-type cytochrome [Flavobacterium caeni]|uniref:c-type cytochrome n=1 Tax=Flavobacterium caeni TaxID=490189 RepID=UPI000B80FF72|nr:cytochrome c [Flavobacterium caeni]
MKIHVFSILIFLFCSCVKSEKVIDERERKLENIDKSVFLTNIGKKYYEDNCIKCHASKSAKDNILLYAIVNDKYDFEFLRAFVTNQDSLVKASNKEAIAIKKEYFPNSAMNHNFKLSRTEIKSIIYYLKQ